MNIKRMSIGSVAGKKEDRMISPAGLLYTVNQYVPYGECGSPCPNIKLLTLGIHINKNIGSKQNGTNGL